MIFGAAMTRCEFHPIFRRRSRGRFPNGGSTIAATLAAFHQGSRRKRLCRKSKHIVEYRWAEGDYNRLLSSASNLEWRRFVRSGSKSRVIPSLLVTGTKQ